jgi:hypothetical protein
MENDPSNEDYEPVAPKYYNYKGKEDLILYFDDDILSFDHVYICGYKITTKAMQPFLNFLLTKSSDGLQLPEVPIFKSFDATELISYSKVYLFSLCKLIEFEPFLQTLVFHGFYKFENNLYLFFDLTCCELNIKDVYSNNKLWFALVDEIVNQRKLCNLKIEESVSNLFICNENLCFLIDDHHNHYEIPMVGFFGTSKEKVSFTSVFGESAKNNNAILGPYFYFTNFTNSFSSDCIVRVALFTGCVKYIENDSNDPVDESEIKKYLLMTDSRQERFTTRISDHDGLWAQNYNTAYVGQLELDDGSYLENTPLIVVKQYEQQCPLSYHFVNKKTMEKGIDAYEIM